MDDPAAADNEESNWGMFAHLSALAGLLVPLGNVIGPLVIWLTKGKESAFIGEQAREALNFQITILIAAAVGLVLALILVGLLFLYLLAIVDLVFVILATVTASRGRIYRYPLTLRLVK